MRIHQTQFYCAWTGMVYASLLAHPSRSQVLNYSPALKKGGYTGFALSFRDSVILWVSNTFRWNVSSHCLFLETARPTKLKLDTRMENEWMCRVYRNQDAASYSSLYFFNFLHLFLQILIFALFPGTVRPIKLKLGTHVDKGRVYCVYMYRN